MEMNKSKELHHKHDVEKSKEAIKSKYKYHTNDEEETKEEDKDLIAADLEEEIWGYIDHIKSEDPDLYCLLKCNLWKIIKGPHFDHDYINEAIHYLAETFGKREPRWKCEETKQIGEKFGVKFNDEHSECDWCYAMNLMYFLFSKLIQDNLQAYVKYACEWLNDISIPEGKAFWHYHRVLKSKEEE